MQEKEIKVTEEQTAVEQPSFEVRNFRENRPTYAIGGALVWKNKPKKEKTYPVVAIKSVRIRQGGFIVREDVLEQSRKLFEQTHELIPVALDIKNILVNGYEQYLIAIENKHTNIAYIPVKITKKEKQMRRRRNKKRESRQRYNMRKAQRKKSGEKKVSS